MDRARIYFDDFRLAQAFGSVALVFILFSGGLDTDWKYVRPVLGPGIALSTVGVLLAALLAGAFAHFALGFTALEGVLLGAIVSATDAAAVLALLRTGALRLRGQARAPARVRVRQQRPDGRLPHDRRHRTHHDPRPPAADPRA